MLWSQDKHQTFTRSAGPREGFLRFKRIASTIMNNDGVAFVLLCLVTRDTLPLALPWRLVGGLGLLGLGIGTKLWAARTLGIGGYYWENFFTGGRLVLPNPPGPYRYLRNPMYTVGNLHMYGLALLLASRAGLGSALFAQLALMSFHYLVEQPHFKRLARQRESETAR